MEVHEGRNERQAYTVQIVLSKDDPLLPIILQLTREGRCLLRDRDTGFEMDGNASEEAGRELESILLGALPKGIAERLLIESHKATERQTQAQGMAGLLRSLVNLRGDDLASTLANIVTPGKE
jgi:hypothetical protein